ncbi:MAG: 1-(5-phosphoribosyl)-5-[(5-phosphoribosylamino)methylideneamino] imidazole-4-carboxamide isomerase [Methanobacteriota archaeon]|nr:MAG: 1-(5-phosphoribosyl)-5-[(5-phosphoribosylamino)methylideneamino] imidazole-4-carboxamide isomerase [Euryarchaeota archaeon]
MSFLVIPAVDLKEGRCVRLVQGDPKRRTVELENPVEVAKNWEAQGARRLHVVDLDGALEGVRRNEAVLKGIVSELGIPVQFGGGIRGFEDASRLLDLGVEKIILGTAALKSPELLERLKDKYGRERLMVALDSRSGKVVTEGWVKDTGLKATDIVKDYEALASEVLFTNVDVEGLVKGIDLKVIEEMVRSTRMAVIASGGVSSLGDIEAVKRAGAGGVVIGTALYKGLIDFKDALTLQEM